MRALRPYLARLSPEHRNLLMLAKQRALNADASNSTSTAEERLDHVRHVVVFGAGEGGRLALQLAGSCGWSVPYLVDNNPGLWDREVHGVRVRPPSMLMRRDFDLILVASSAGKQPLFEQLNRMGFTRGANYAFFLDPVTVGNIRHQVTL